MGLIWKNFAGLHRYLTRPPLNTFGINQDLDCEPHSLNKHQGPISKMFFWNNVQIFPQTLKPVRKPAQKNLSYNLK